MGSRWILKRMSTRRKVCSARLRDGSKPDRETMSRSRWAGVGLLCVLVAGPATSQTVDRALSVTAAEPEPPRLHGASPLLEADHWAARTARRAEAMGLAPSFLPAQSGPTRDEVA